MRSSSYVKAMGDEESGDSDSSPKNSPQKSVRPGGLIKNVLQRQLSDQSHSYHLQASRDIHPSITLDPSPNYNSPKFRSRNQSYMRAVSTLSQASCVSQVSQVSEAEMNGQFESVCESVFSEVESQAMEALDLPGCFRTRSHSYLRAIQAGYSQDDECVPSMSSSTVTSTIRSTAEGNEVLEGMGFINEDSFFNKEADMTSMSQRDLNHHRRESESRSLYSNRSSTTVPSLSPHKTSVPVRPRPVPSSVQETADLALAISQQWREDVSAMRKELAELRRDLCTELRAFNSNFSTFAQRYNTWSPNVAKGGQNRSDHVSVSTQAGSKTLMRQNTADAAVNCPSPIDPNVLSMHSPDPEPLDKNVLHVSTTRPLFQTEPTSQLTELDDPTYANLTPPEPVDLSLLSWSELGPDPINPPDLPEPELPFDPRYYSKFSASERIDSIVIDITNIEPVNLANLHWPKLDADNIISPESSPFQEALDPSVSHHFIQESSEEFEACALSSGIYVATERQPPIRKFVVSPIVLIESTEETSDHILEDYTVVEPGDCIGPNPLTPESMDLNDLKWPSLESLDPGLPSPGFSDLPDPPTPEAADYDEPAEHSAEDPPFPELLDTIFLQPATPEPVDSDVSNSISPEPMSPELQSSAKFEPDPVVLWSKKETMDLNQSDFPHLNIRTSSWSEMDPEIISPAEPTYMESSVAYLTQLSSLESASVTLHDPSPLHLDDQYAEESDDQVTDYPLKADTLDSAMIDLLESEAVFSAILCTVEPDDPEFETLTMDEALEIAAPGNSSPATIDPATVHPFNLSLLELQAALDVSKRETTDNGSPRGTMASTTSPSCRDFLWIRWQRRLRGRTPMSRSARIQFRLPSSGSVDRPSQQPPASPFMVITMTPLPLPAFVTWMSILPRGRRCAEAFNGTACSPDNCLLFRALGMNNEELIDSQRPGVLSVNPSDFFSSLWGFLAVTYTPSTPTYTRTPPPVPPRSASKPLISITAQSSTESTQDAYHEERLARGGLWGSDGLGLGLGRVRYNSTDSLDSAKAVTIAMEAAAMAMAGKRHPSTDSHSSVLTCDKAILVEAATDSESEGRGLREYHSVGIQVEDDKRFKRSNSVTAAVQADLELEGFPAMEDKGLQFGGGGLQRHSEPSTPTQYGAVRTVRTQGLFSYRDDYRSANEPSSPQRSAEPWREPSVPSVPTVAVTVTPPQASDSGRASPSARRDGTWFMQLLHAETKRMEGWCKEMEGEAEENDLSEEILGKIRSAVGSAQLLMSQKFQQFYWLCQQNLDPSAMPRPTSQDLAGFWDLLQLSIDDVTAKFDELQKIKSNDWRIIESPVKKLPPPVPKKMLKKSVTREKSLDLPDRQRQEARRRLMAAKRAASFRQNSATERADSIEIYIPEAQTRL
ncbi:Disks large-associated protein 2 [Bagarius yarrelli]|uniref:Disks large-associated protein 2 n=1 Tax=Bagarius yarrelli TaxID=175774 RepID=A0A556V2V5_BAGYA|nr:Disks large-associated protein 2 [Bagarius yarrelli]